MRRVSTRRTSVMLAWIMLSAESLIAQPPLQAGARVRLWLAPPATDSVVGTVMTSARDTVSVRIAAGSLRHVPLESVLRIEASGGSRSRWLDGAIVGVALGAGAGLIYAAQHTRADGRQRDPICWFDQCGESVTPGSSISKPRAATIGALAGGGLGVLIGAAARGPERWQDVWVRDRSARQQTRVP
jgi:hypothetical protein